MGKVDCLYLHHRDHQSEEQAQTALLILWQAFTLTLDLIISQSFSSDILNHGDETT